MKKGALVRIPIKENGEIDYAFMANYMRGIECHAQNTIDQFITV